jgi:hypothetical protein
VGDISFSQGGGAILRGFGATPSDADGGQGGGPSMKRIILAVVAALTLLLGASAAAADPDFGPGNSSKGPNDGGAKCHPPGQTETAPGCK